MKPTNETNIGLIGLIGVKQVRWNSNRDNIHSFDQCRANPCLSLNNSFRIPLHALGREQIYGLADMLEGGCRVHGLR
jgi:hypothetical protein